MISPKTKAPINALSIIPVSDMKNGIPDITLKATNKLAPEFIPNTYGPAKGLLKRVCMSNPAIDNPTPAIKAIVILGILISLAIM